MSSSCYLRFRRGGGEASHLCSDDLALTHIRAIHGQVKGEYGWPRIHKELQARGLRIGKERVRKLMTEHLGHERNEAVSNPAGNTRNGKSKKTLKGDFGELPIEIPRDRHGSFEPQLIAKHQTRWAGFDDKIISLYARGMTVREIQSHLQQILDTH